MNKELTHQEDRTPSRKPNPLDCDNSCSYGHLSEAWLQSEDKFFCTDCMVDYWADELRTGIMIEPADSREESEYFELCKISVIEDGYIFQGFQVEHPEPWPVQIITLSELECLRAVLNKWVESVSKGLTNQAETVTMQQQSRETV